jgi:hypothetical protein
MTGIESRSVSWWPTHEFISALVDQANHLPVAGTTAWCALEDADPAKLLALAAAGEHHVLRVETAQAARADASRAVSESADWSTIAREYRQRSEFRSVQPWTSRMPVFLADGVRE